MGMETNADHGRGQTEGHRRNLSSTSRFLAEGSFTRSAGVPEPVITSVCVHARAPSANELSRTANASVLPHWRFRSVPSRTWLGSWKFTEPELADSADLLWEEVCSSKAEVMQRVHELVPKGLLVGGGKMPWWECVILRNASNDDEQYEVVLLRVHHVIGDGIGIAHALADMFTDKHGNALSGSNSVHLRRRDDTRESKDQSHDSNAVDSRKKEEKEQKKARGHHRTSCFGYMCSAILDLFYALTLPLIPGDTQLRTFSGEKLHTFGGRREIVYCDCISLSKVKEVQHAAGVSFNDVVMSVTAGAIRRHAVARHDEAAQARSPRVRALMPFAFPRAFSEVLRNSWCFVSTAIAFGESSGAYKRLEATHAYMNRLKSGTLPSVMYFVQQYVLGSAPMPLVRTTNTNMFKQHSLVFSNVPGPQREVYICGQKVEHMYFLFANLLPQVDVFTYDGSVYVNMLIDPSVVQQAQSIADFWREEFEELARSVGVDVSESAWSARKEHFASPDLIVCDTGTEKQRQQLPQQQQQHQERERSIRA